MECERKYLKCTGKAEVVLKSGRKTCRACLESGESEDIVDVLKPISNYGRL